jgi:hypothetical protein
MVGKTRRQTQKQKGSGIFNWFRKRFTKKQKVNPYHTGLPENLIKSWETKNTVNNGRTRRLSISESNRRRAELRETKKNRSWKNFFLRRKIQPRTTFRYTVKDTTPLNESTLQYMTLEKEYETVKDECNRIFIVLYQLMKYKQQNPFLQRNESIQWNYKQEELRPEQKSELIINVLLLLYKYRFITKYKQLEEKNRTLSNRTLSNINSINSNSPTTPTRNRKSRIQTILRKQLNNDYKNEVYFRKNDEYINSTILNDLTDLSYKEFLETYEQFRKNQLKQLKKPILKPYGGILNTRSRLFSYLLRSTRELEYVYDMLNYICKYTPTEMSSNCFILSYDIQNVLMRMNQEPHYKNSLYIVVFPKYHAYYVSAYRFPEKDNQSVSNTIIDINKTYIDKVSMIQDAFKNKGIQLIHPLLAFTLQKQYKSLWKTSEFYNVVENYDPATAICILTLQKYAAIRRYMWTNDPSVAAEVYTLDPRALTLELRTPMPDPAYNTTNPNKENIKFYTMYYTANFENEFKQNQMLIDRKSKLTLENIRIKLLSKISFAPADISYAWKQNLLSSQTTSSVNPLLDPLPEEAWARSYIDNSGYPDSKPPYLPQLAPLPRLAPPKFNMTTITAPEITAPELTAPE